MTNYTKKDVVDKMRELGIDGEPVTKKDCERFLDLALEAIIVTLGQGREEEMHPKTRVRSTLTMVGFGTFEVVVTNPRRVHNPRNTDQRHVMPPHNRIRFRSGKLLNDSIENILVTQ